MPTFSVSRARLVKFAPLFGQNRVFLDLGRIFYCLHPLLSLFGHPSSPSFPGPCCSLAGSAKIPPRFLSCGLIRLSSTRPCEGKDFVRPLRRIEVPFSACHVTGQCGTSPPAFGPYILKDANADFEERTALAVPAFPSPVPIEVFFINPDHSFRCHTRHPHHPIFW